MMYPINDEDIGYELECAKSESIDSWLKYTEFKSKSPVLEQAFVYERACQKFGRSYKLWKGYLDLRSQHLNHADYTKYKDEYEVVIELYDRALVLLNKMPRIWTDYLQFIMHKLPSATRIRHTFDRALQALPPSQHDRIWPLYLQFARRTSAQTQCVIWKRYMLFDDSRLEECIKVLIRGQDYTAACDALMKAIDDPDFESADGKSRFQLWEELIDLLVHQDTPFDVEKILRSAIERYTDQRGRLWVNLATYFINTGRNDRARDVFEQGVRTSMSIRDFAQIFDAYVEFEEALISRMMESDDEMVDIRMEAFEQLMDRRPFIINNIMLKQDSNNVAEWQKQVALWGENKHQVVETFTRAIETINPAKAKHLSQLWVDYAKFYESQGSLKNARIILDKATKVPFNNVNELANVWIEWAEMELRQDSDDSVDRALKVMAAATCGPEKSNVSFFDESKPPQERLHKCMKAWSFYLDLAESSSSSGDDENSLATVRELYDRVFELKIATALTIVNYANLLEEHNYFEESFKVYERGVAMFSYPVAFELWNIYLQKAVSRELGIERLRDLFEQALEHCPAKFSKPIFMLYGKVEEERGLTSNVVKVYNRAVEHVDAKDKLAMFQHYVARVASIKDLASTRPIFQQALESLNDADSNTICADFIDVEVRLGELERARAIYAYCAQFNDPDYNPNFWSKWEKFEVDNGNEASFKEMLRVKRETRRAQTYNVQHLAQERLASQVNAPKGFVIATETTPKSREPEPESNPDQIDIDI